jgi:homoprotocatechuate degradation regulator HpaR
MTRGRGLSFAHRNLPLLLLHARETIFSRFRSMLGHHGLTEQQWRIIRALLETGPLEQREIVATCHLSSSSLAGILARMEKLGLVQRRRLGHDQRRVQVSLTPKSRALAAKMAPLIEQTYVEIEATLGPERFAELFKTLDDVIECLGGAEAWDETPE